MRQATDATTALGYQRRSEGEPINASMHLRTCMCAHPQAVGEQVYTEQG